MLEKFHKYASLKIFYGLSKTLSPWLAGLTAILMAGGLFSGLVLAPADYQQGDSFRIIYVHVPAAWMSLFIYMVLAANGFITLVWRVKLAEIIGRVSAPLGASFTALALATGMLWGKPMWGAYWVWDARLTSELILLFLYLGYIALQSAYEDPRAAGRACAVLAIIGSINVPIVHYSVEWWATLHQGPTVTKFDKPSISLGMLVPLLVMVGAYMTYFFTLLLVGARSEILRYERNKQWLVHELSAA